LHNLHDAFVRFSVHDMYKQVSENDTIDEVSAWLRAVTLTIIIVSQAHERKIRHQYK